MKTLGVTRYETFVVDGHTIYYGEENQDLISEPKYDALSISSAPDRGQFKKDLTHHQNGGSDYLRFCSDCARNGIGKWIICMEDMTCTYFDLAGQVLLVEQIPG